MKKLNGGMLVFAIAAGTMFYTYIEFDVFDSSIPADAALEPDSEDSANKQSVFKLFRSPQAIPELRFMNRKNREITLDAFLGSFVLLNIWATWCAPCREEMPALDRLQEKLGGRDFQVLALSIDEAPPSRIKNFYEELKIQSLYVYHDLTGKAFPKLNAPGIPATFLIDRDGRSIGYVIGPVEWDRPDVVKEIRSYVYPVEESN